MNKRRPDGMQSKLLILESIASDYGNYNCSVANTHGKDSLMITLKPESKYGSNTIIIQFTRL